jgi:hypothetical protein
MSLLELNGLTKEYRRGGRAFNAVDGAMYVQGQYLYAAYLARKKE